MFVLQRFIESKWRMYRQYILLCRVESRVLFDDDALLVASGTLSETTRTAVCHIYSLYLEDRHFW